MCLYIYNNGKEKKEEFIFTLVRYFYDVYVKHEASDMQKYSLLSYSIYFVASKPGILIDLQFDVNKIK